MSLLLGEIFGKTTPKHFSMKLFQEAKRHDFVVVKDNEGRWVLSQIEQLENLPEGEVIAHCKVIGYRERGIIVTPRTPLKPSSLVYKANNEILSEVLGFDTSGLYMGVLESNEDVKVYLNMEQLISKHVAVLATTGSGKSYTVGVLVEEILDNDVPVIIIDPHGEYSSMKYPNDNPMDKEFFNFFRIEPKGYKVVEYSPDTKVNPSAIPLRFEDKDLAPQDIIQMLPAKPTSAQVGLIYSAIKDLKDKKGTYTLDDIIEEISAMESNAKWNIVNMLDVIKSMGIFDKKGTKVKDLVKKGQATIINLRGINVDIQQLVVQRIVKDLFDARKLGKIPPLFLIIEEAHNYIPEKEVTFSSKIIRNVASEGRKFGLGLCIISQRPARVDKNILSQCNTQIILRITNPNDLKAVTYAESIVENLDKEIKNLPVGHALIIGMEVPLFIKVRVRKSKHGGETIKIAENFEEYLHVIQPINYFDLKNPHDYKKIYYPFYHITLEDGTSYLIDAIKGKQLYFENNKAFETEPLDLSKQVKVAFELKEREGNVLDEKISDKIIKKDLGNKLKDLKKVYYVYYVKGNKLIDGVLGIEVRK